jgi:hypothetical protein
MSTDHYYYRRSNPASSNPTSNHGIFTKKRKASFQQVVPASRMISSPWPLSNIWHNISMALGLKAAFLATTLFGVTSLWMAILADTGATVLVTANAMRLLRFRFGGPERSMAGTASGA